MPTMLALLINIAQATMGKHAATKLESQEIPGNVTQATVFSRVAGRCSGFQRGPEKSQTTKGPDLTTSIEIRMNTTSTAWQCLVVALR